MFDIQELHDNQVTRPYHKHEEAYLKKKINLIGKTEDFKIVVLREYINFERLYHCI